MNFKVGVFSNTIAITAEFGLTVGQLKRVVKYAPQALTHYSTAEAGKPSVPLFSLMDSKVTTLNQSGMTFPFQGDKDARVKVLVNLDASREDAVYAAGVAKRELEIIETQITAALSAADAVIASVTVE